MSEDDINIERNKRLLDEIREQRNGRDNQFSSRGYAASRTGSNNEVAPGDTGLIDRTPTTPRSDDRRTQAPGANQPVAERLGSRDRQVGGETVTPPQGTISDNRRRKENIAPPPVQEAKKFSLRIPFLSTDAEKSKLFTKQEAEDEKERLTEIYFRGSGLLDDILEIVTKDHEPVQIWQLSEDEADTLASMHLVQAQRDKAAARAARKLLEIYDRIYVYMVVLPRVKASYGYVKEHGGLSWR